MSFYGNQIIETDKSYSQIIVNRQAYEGADSTTLIPSTQESVLNIVPADPWSILQGVPETDTIYINHTTTEDKLSNSFSPIEGEKLIDINAFQDDEDFSDLNDSNIFLKKYCSQVWNNNSDIEQIILSPGDELVALAPTDNENPAFIDNAGHIGNIKMIKYKFISSGSLQYDKDSWVQSLYGPENINNLNNDWYHQTSNINQYLLPKPWETNGKGYIQDLYEKLEEIKLTLTPSSGGSDDEENQNDLEKLLEIKDDLACLKAQVNNLYYPYVQDVKTVNIKDGTKEILRSDLVRTIMGIADCRLLADTNNFKLEESSDLDQSANGDLEPAKTAVYLNTNVTQVLRGLIDCSFDRPILNNVSQPTTTKLSAEVPMLRQLYKFDTLIQTLEYFFGLVWDTTKEQARWQVTDNGTINLNSTDIYFVQTNISEAEYNSSQLDYYIKNGSQMEKITIKNKSEYPFCQNPETEARPDSITYFTIADKNFIQIQINSENYYKNYQNLYVLDEGGKIYYKAPSNYQAGTKYYVQTGYTEDSVKRLLDAVECYSNGVTTETITEYIAKINSAR